MRNISKYYLKTSGWSLAMKSASTVTHVHLRNGNRYDHTTNVLLSLFCKKNYLKILITPFLRSKSQSIIFSLKGVVLLGIYPAISGVDPGSSSEASLNHLQTDNLFT